MLVVRVLAIFLSLLFVVSAAVAVDVEEHQEVTQKLQELRVQIQEQESLLSDLRASKNRVESTLHKLTSELTDLENRKDALQHVILDLNQRIETNNRSVEEGRENIELQSKLIMDRVVDIYKMRRQSQNIQYLANARTAVDLIKRAHYLSKIADHDSKQINRFNIFIQEYEREQKQLERIWEERLARLDEVTSLEVQLQKKKETQTNLLKQQQKKAKAHSISLAKLKKSADSLEETLSKLMGDQSVDGVKPKFDGLGLASRKGNLELPIIGDLIRQFGKQRHDEFEDMLFVKGLEFGAEHGSSVKSVASGKVVLNQVLPGYGNVVILDHGNRYYTLYGRLVGTRVKLGDEVEEQEELGVVGQTDNHGRNFYFELRIKGKPINPLPYFKKVITLRDGNKDIA